MVISMRLSTKLASCGGQLLTHTTDGKNGFRPEEGLPGVVFIYPNKNGRKSSQHDEATRVAVAERLAALKGFHFAGEYDSALTSGRPRYLVPADTIVGLETARKLGITSEADFFGGLVPYPFMSTKTITHPLIKGAAAAPNGWCERFPVRIRDAVLFGFAAFTMEDARLACARVLERGDARLKPGLGVGGQGQEVVSTLDESDRALDCLNPEELSIYGMVIEENLQEVTTYSIGTVCFDEIRIAYCGTQRLTHNHHNQSVYGGSDLLVIRGDFEKLLQLDLTPALRLAVEQARVYDLAASAEIAGFLASRRNYDVASGLDGRGRKRGGVLEQSWRIGGASSAEVAALEVFRADAGLQCVRASCAEIYDAGHEPPSNARVSFWGEDQDVGSLIKYSVVERYGDTR